MKLPISQTLCALSLLAVLAACESNQSGATAPDAPNAPTPPTVPTAPTAPTAPHPIAQPASSSTPAIVLTAQPGWIAELATSSMRKAQYRLPRADGNSEDASLIVYYFGAQAGTREANLDRWAGQFEQPDGSDSAETMETSTRTVAGLEVTDVALSGTYVAETAPGSGERVNKPGWRMQASIVETKEGPWYFKLVGPAATVAKWEASYDTFVKAIRPAK